jgi:hypothetical protein
LQGHFGPSSGTVDPGKGLWKLESTSIFNSLVQPLGLTRTPEQGLCALHRARGGGAHRAGPWAAACAGAGRLQGGDAKRRRARSAICGSRSGPRRRPALQLRAGTYTWHRARQSRRSSARAARRRAHLALGAGFLLGTARTELRLQLRLRVCVLLLRGCPGCSKMDFPNVNVLGVSRKK